MQWHQNWPYYLVPHDRTWISFLLLVFALSETLYERIDVIQRKMLRQILGFRYRDAQTWEEYGRLLKEKLNTLMSNYSIDSWSNMIKEQTKKLKERVENGNAPFLTKTVVE